MQHDESLKVPLGTQKTLNEGDITNPFFPYLFFRYLFKSRSLAFIWQPLFRNNMQHMVRLICGV